MTDKETELEVLLGQQVVQVGSDKITIKEYSLADSMALFDDIEVLATKLAPVLDTKLEYGELEKILASNFEIVKKLLSYSINKPETWIDTIKATEAQILLDYWWAINGRFFIQTAQRKKYQKEMQQASDGEKSLQRSSDTDTAQES